MYNDNHLMIDIETMDNVSTAVVTAIGAVVFNLKDGVTDEFHVRINPRSAQAAGATVGADTVLWWINQSTEAQEELKGKEDFTDAMLEFRKFCLGKGIKHVWGNAPTFDCAILNHSYKLVSAATGTNTPTPWRFYQERCYRTLKNLYPSIEKSITREGTHHNGLDDAKHQAIVAMEILTHILESSPELEVVQ